MLDYGPGEVVSGTRTVTVVQSQVTTAVIHYKRADGNYAPWGLHLFNASSPDAMAPGEATPAWDRGDRLRGDGRVRRAAHDRHRQRHGQDRLHRPRPRAPANPDTKDPADSPDRFFVPLATPEIWLREGDVRIYSCAAANDTCVVPSA